MVLKQLRPLTPWVSGRRPWASGPGAPGVSHGTYCMDLVRRRDYENYLATLLLPQALQRSAFAVRAFNVEISGIKDSVSDRTIGLIRMQFWRDAVEQSAVPAQPVAQELRRAMSEHAIAPDLLLRVIASRERFLAPNPFPSLDEVESYACDAFASVNFALLACLNAHRSETTQTGHARHAANQLGMAQGLATLLRGVPYLAHQRQVLLPTELMMSQNVSAESVIRTGDSPGLRLVIEAIAARAQEHLENCRFRQKLLSRDERLLMLPAIGVDAFLSKLHRVECNVFDPQLRVKNSWLPAQLFIHKLRGNY